MRIILFYFLLLTVTMYAMYKGGAPEKWVAASYFFTGAAGTFVNTFVPAGYSEMEAENFATDFVMWIAFLIVALRAKRFWPLCVVSIQTISMVAHMTKFMDVSIVPRAYYIMQVASSYPLLITLAIGTYCHQRRLKANGTDPAWRSS